jgi:hypothetical protein
MLDLCLHNQKIKLTQIRIFLLLVIVNMTQTAIFITLLFLEGARDAIGMLRIISE